VLLEALEVGREDRVRGVSVQGGLGVVDLAIVSFDLLVEPVELALRVHPVLTAVLLDQRVTLALGLGDGDRDEPDGCRDGDGQHNEPDDPGDAESTHTVGVATGVAPLTICHGHDHAPYAHPVLHSQIA
jgi:hypothetical protein